MNFPYYIAKRYLLSKSKNNAINIITIIAGIGVFAGALALFIVLSGFSGLRAFSLQFTNDIDPDLKILPARGKVFDFDSVQAQNLQNLSGVQDYSKVIEERILMNFDDKYTPAFIKGVDSNYNQITSTKNSIIAGNWFQENSNRVVVGTDLARKLSLGIGGYGNVLKLLVPKPGKGIITDPREAFNVANTYVSGVYAINDDLNGKYVFTSFSLAKNLLHLKPDQVSGIELKLMPEAREKTVKEEMKAIFGEDVIIKNRIQLNDELYKMLNTENLAVYLIFTLVIIIALFNVGGAIVMAILDKRDNIKTLFNLGTPLQKIKRIFFLHGALLTFVSGIIGLIIGLIVVYLQQQFGMVMITQSLPYPVRLKLENVGVVFLTIMTLGLAASYIGSTRVSKALQ